MIYGISESVSIFYNYVYDLPGHVQGQSLSLPH